MSTPPDTTLLVLEVPADYLLGIDTQFFESTDNFKGIKSIPPGVHLFHWAKDRNSVRHGKFFEAKDRQVLIFQWDNVAECMEIDGEIGELNVSAQKSRLGDYYPFLLPYPSDLHSSWNKLVSSNIKIADFEKFIPGGLVTSLSTSEAENELLRRSLMESAQSRSTRTGRNVEEDEIIKSLLEDKGAKEEELHFTPIDLKRTWGNEMVGVAVTENYFDKSWYLNNVILKYHSVKELFAEIQVSFVLLLVFANYSGAEQWKKLAELFLRCKKDVVIDTQRFVDIIRLLSSQLEQCPEEYFDELLQRSFVANLFFQFRNTVKDLSDTIPGGTSFQELKSVLMGCAIILESKFGVDINEAEMEDDEEESPVIVDI